MSWFFVGDLNQAVFSCLTCVSRLIMACRISGRSVVFAFSRATISSIWAGVVASADAARAVAGSAGGFRAGVGEVRAISPTR